MLKAATITSATNPLLKGVRRAIARGGLTEEGWCVAETFHLLEEALRSRWQVKVVLAAESAQEAAGSLARRVPDAKFLVLPDTLLQSTSCTETSQGVMALLQPREAKLDELFREPPLVLLLDGIQDPGNAGAVARAAEAFGATGLLFLKGSVSPYNPKTLRGSAGSLFRMPFLHGVEPALALAALQQHGVRLYAAVPASASPPAKVDFTAACGVVIGNEARGVSAALRAAALEVSIPTAGVESLNAAVAAGILLYEAARQRMARP